MRDLSRVGATGAGKSRGYAFINFADHIDALSALRATNNKPGIFGDKKRLIVEFSLENRLTLQAKQKRAERAKAKHCFLTNTSVPREKKESKLVHLSSDVHLNADGGKHKSGVNILPSHTGPKVRHKRRPSSRIKKNNGGSIRQKESQTKKHKRRSLVSNAETYDNVDKLVEKYRQKLSSVTYSK